MFFVHERILQIYECLCRLEAKSVVRISRSDFLTAIRYLTGRRGLGSGLPLEIYHICENFAARSSYHIVPPGHAISHAVIAWHIPKSYTTLTIFGARTICFWLVSAQLGALRFGIDWIRLRPVRAGQPTCRFLPKSPRRFYRLLATVDSPSPITPHCKSSRLPRRGWCCEREPRISG